MQNVGNMGKSALRVAKNYTRGYTDVQTKVRDATSNDAWGPSGTQMSEIAALTYNQGDFVEIMEMLDKRLNDKGKNWRHVFKSLTLLDYCLHAGSENCILYFRENIYIVKTLKEFQYLDETGKDQGANVRQKAKDITNLLNDESRLKNQRKSRAHMKDRMNGGTGDNGRPSKSSFEEESPRKAPPPRGGDDMAAAIEASKRSAEEDAARARRNGQDDNDLEKAMRLSREEEEKRKRDLAASNGDQLFDDQPNNNLIDMSGPSQQMPMMTGMPFASFNPYAAQQQQQQEEWARQQQMVDLQRQAEEMAYMQHQQLAQQQQLQQEEYMRQQQYQQQMYQQSLLQQQQQQQQQPLVPQPTAYGSNNPFAAFAPSTPPPMPQQQPAYIPPPQPQPQPQPIAAQATSMPRPPKDDGKNSELARLLAAGREDGLDTFGNIGSMRVPAQFAQRTGALNAQATGRTNPFGFSDSFGNPRVNPQQPPQQQQQPNSNSSPFFTI